MKAQQLIADALSEWREVQDAPDLAQQLFDRLDDDEIERLAVRGFTDEVRAALRRKDSGGVPVYANVERIDKDGSRIRLYKQTSLFTVDDYRIAVASYERRAAANHRVAVALAKDCKTRLHVTIPLPGMENTA